MVFSTAPKHQNFDNEGICYQLKYPECGTFGRLTDPKPNALPCREAFSAFVTKFMRCNSALPPDFTLSFTLSSAHLSITGVGRCPNLYLQQHWTTHTTVLAPVTGYIARSRPENSVTAKLTSLVHLAPFLHHAASRRHARHGKSTPTGQFDGSNSHFRGQQAEIGNSRGSYPPVQRW